MTLYLHTFDTKQKKMECLYDLRKHKQDDDFLFYICKLFSKTHKFTFLGFG